MEWGHPVHCGVVSPPIGLPITCLPVVTTKNVPWPGAELALGGPPWVRIVSDSPGDTVFYNHWFAEGLSDLYRLPIGDLFWYLIFSPK